MAKGNFCAEIGCERVVADENETKCRKHRATDEPLVWQMWPTEDGEKWVFGAVVNEQELDAALKKIEAAKLPKPMVGGAAPRLRSA